MASLESKNIKLKTEKLNGNIGPVKPELGVIPSGQKKKKKFNSERLNFLGKELNATDTTKQ